MPFQLTITAGNRTVDYSKIVDWTTIKITEHVNMPTSLQFSLYNLGGLNFVAPVQRAYVKIYSPLNDRSVFTGFITSEPNRAYISVSQEAIGQYQDLMPGLKIPPQLFRYDIICTSDEYLLNSKSLPFIPSFINRTQGQILAQLANILAPGFFDTTNCASGDLVPYYDYDPKKSWSEIAKDFADGSRYRYKARDKQISFVPYDDAPLGITYDEKDSQTLFTPSDLSTTVLAVPLVNDVTVIGQAEAGNNREDYFIGDGFTGNFPLRHKVFRGSTSLLLQESWQNKSLNTQNWYLLDPFTNFDFSAGALNVVTASAIGPIGTAYLQMNNGIEIAGGIDLQAGECTFNDYCHGVIGGIYSDVQFTQAELLGGFMITSPGTIVTSASGAGGIQMQPMWDGVTGPAIVSVPNHTYVLQTVITAPQYSRYNRIYRTIEGEEFGGVSTEMTGSLTFIIQDYDIAAATGLFYQPKVTRWAQNNVQVPAFAVYGLVNNIRLNITMDNTTVGIMPYGGLYADIGPLGLILPSGAILPMLPPDSGGFIGTVPLWPNGAYPPDGSLYFPPLELAGWQAQVLGNGLALQAAQITAGNDADTLGFYVQSIPAAGTPVRLQTWEQQAAVARLQDQASITNEAFVVGDDGIRSAIVTDLNPLPRVSEDCDSAALAYLTDRTRVFYNGTYNCSSLSFFGLTSDQQFYPTPGRFLKVNSPHRGIVNLKFLVVDIVMTMRSAADELIQFQLSFGADMYTEKLLKHFVDIQPPGVLTPQDKANPPNPRFTINVSNSFLPDINALRASEIKTDHVQCQLDEAYAYQLEVRTTDFNWGRPAVDYVGRFSGPNFRLNRQQYDQQWYMRYTSEPGMLAASGAASGAIYSRRSKVVRVMYPMKPSSPLFVSSTASQSNGPGNATIDSFQVQLNFNGDQRNIYGIEIRAADNLTVLYQVPALNYALLNVDLGAQTPMPWLPAPLNTEFSLYAYFFNHQWEYSAPLIIDVQLLQGTRFPYIWSPSWGTAIPTIGEECATRASFGIQPDYTIDASGTGVAYSFLKGTVQANLASKLIGEPVLSAGPTTGGSLPAGVYLVAASAEDNLVGVNNNFGVSPLGDILTATVQANGAIAVSVLSNPNGINLYLASPDQANGWFFAGHITAGTLTHLITTFARIGGSAPDPLFDHYHIDYSREWIGGIAGVQISPSGVTATTLTLAGLQMATDILVGRVVSLLAHDNTHDDVELVNFVITHNSNSSTNTIITVGPNSQSVSPPDLTTIFQDLDIVTIRAQFTLATSTTIQDTLFLNNLNTGLPQSITSLTSSGLVATATSPNHGLLSDQNVLIAGAVQTGYNGQFVITVIDDDTFTYPLTSTQTSPATGTITVATQGAIPDQFIGRIARIIYGTGYDQTKNWRGIVGNSSYGFTLDTPFDVAPDSTSIIIITDPSLESSVDTQSYSVPNRASMVGIMATLNIQNLANVTWFIRVFTADINGNYTDNPYVPFREQFLFGAPGSVNAVQVAR